MVAARGTLCTEVEQKGKRRNEHIRQLDHACVSDVKCPSCNKDKKPDSPASILPLKISPFQASGFRLWSWTFWQLRVECYDVGCPS